MIRKVKNRYRLLEISIILIIIPAMILIAFIMVSENNFLTTNYSTMNSNWKGGFQETDGGFIINKASSSTGYQLQWNFTIIGSGGGVDEGRKLVVDDNGYLYVAGMIDQGASSVNLFLIKFDQNGNLLWNRSLSSSGTYWDKGFGLVYYKNYLYLTGRYYISGNYFDIIIIKYDTDGNLIWNKTWGGTDYEEAWDIAAENDHLFITGYTKSWGSGLNDLIVAKFDLSGNLIWNYTWGDVSTDNGNGIVVKDDDIYVVGESLISGNYQVVIMRLLDMGTTYSVIWNKTWGGTGDDKGHDIALDSNNYIYVTGETESFGLGQEDVFLLKYSATGVNIWNSTWGDSDSDIAYGISIDANDNIFITGHTKSYAADAFWDLFVLQYDVNGNMPWSMTWHKGQYDDGYSVLSIKNSLYITGSTQAVGGVDRDLIVLKYSIPEVQETTTAIPGFELGYILIPLMISIISLIQYKKFKWNNLKAIGL